ncbi:TPA: glycosyltransferase [Streptococcus suis]|uniref:Glycosyltransferase n=1 Tax=Streptococcus suis TaxID=1307 RepID=M1VP02_STRSU|nr:glycosyltransferase [Streptococcus suis]MBS8079605.1 glycosyltransferase [Streptococcus suis]MCK3972689.1 glycosyltransferase [Streptococcus suis]MDW8732239.1 glycosyltransferase [Streptococcus suis]BAM94757.1 glycosyltransferase [Streptococcus suis]HEL1702555.1 glycosyltransferase [Streptococcus suis]
MGKEVLVSIIMGAYNNENTISRAIESILAQTHQNWEFIICDDCSTDSTLQILEEFSKIDQRIKVLTNAKNSKLAYSLNRCLEYCNGEFVARMDADDISKNSRISKQLDFLQSNLDIDLVGSNAYVDSGTGEYGVRMVKEVPTKEDIIYGPTFIHPSVMFRKKAILDIGGYTVSNRTFRGQDWDLWFKFFANELKAYNIQEYLLIYSEPKEAAKKRTFFGSVALSKTAFWGFKKLNVPLWKYPIALKPVVSFFIKKFFF